MGISTWLASWLGIQFPLKIVGKPELMHSFIVLLSVWAGSISGHNCVSFQDEFRVIVISITFRVMWDSYRGDLSVCRTHFMGQKFQACLWSCIIGMFSMDAKLYNCIIHDYLSWLYSVLKVFFGKAAKMCKIFMVNE